MKEFTVNMPEKIKVVITEYELPSAGGLEEPPCDFEITDYQIYYDGVLLDGEITELYFDEKEEEIIKAINFND